MILQSLNKLYDRLAADPAYLIPQPGYSTQKVAFAVVLKRGGELLRIEDIRQLQGRRRIPRTMFLPGQTKPSGSGTNPGLLWDNSSYLMAHVPPRNGDESKQHYAKRRRRAALCFNSFRTRHLSLERTIDDDHFSMVCRFLEAWSPPRAGRHPLLDELIGGFGLFRIAGESGFVHERPAIQNYWQAQTTPDASPAEDDICLVTGRPGVAARTHQPRLKGISGAQSTGATLVSFNCSAFGSYGRDQSHNAPVSERIVFRYGTALNGLLDGPRSVRHRFALGETTIVVWTERSTEAEGWIGRLVTDGLEETPGTANSEHFNAFRQVLEHGGSRLRLMGDDPDTPVRLLALSPNAGRVSVRLWHAGTLGDLFDRFKAHFDAMRIVRQFDDTRRWPNPRFPSIAMILRETAREAKAIPALLSGALIRAILDQARYPDALAQAITRRIRSDGGVDYIRAATLKAWLVRNPFVQGVIPVSLDTGNLEPAYLLGRLFAVLESAHATSVGDLGTGIRQRHFGSASITPAMAFPRLLRNYQHHLGTMTSFEKRMFEHAAQEILDGIGHMPPSFNLADQACFAIGYYHQRKHLFDGSKAADPTGANGG